MKKTFLLLTAIALFATSCSVSKAAREKRGSIDGSWTLTDISYENNTGNFKSTIFNDAEDICFEGSEWFFRNNNSTGKYTINPSTLCNGGDRFIRWSINENPESYSSQLQFKFTDEKFKDIAGKVGYRLNIASLTTQEMILKSNSTIDGEIVTIVYKFAKK